MLRLAPILANGALLLLSAPALAFQPVVCSVTIAGETTRYRIDGRHITDLGSKARHPLSKHRRAGRADVWDSMLDGMQPGEITITNRRRMFWNPAGTVKLRGACRDSR